MKASSALALLLGSLGLLGGGAAPSAASDLVVAAASDLKFAMEEVVAGFQKQRPEIAVQLSYGSSGNFYAQLSERAPFDLFFSADAEYPKRLEAAGQGLPGSYFLYAVGRIVLWVPRSSGIDPARGLEILLAPGIKKVAIANPRHAPYGRAAEAALEHAGLYERIQPKLVLGENVAQAAQFAQSGAADAAIVAHSLALAPAMEQSGRYWELPPGTYPRLDQAGLILKWASDPGAANAFRAFVLGPEGSRILGRWGFVLPRD
jgi:molybdate transport system substrate-binding protein